MPINLPPRLLAAITNDAGGQVTVVIGAGCSLEPPTDIPLSKDLSLSAHYHLVANNDIPPDACKTPEDLSALAEAVVRCTGTQGPLVSMLRRRIRGASPNRGYDYAAALLIEGAIGDLITLNFDDAQSTALSRLGTSDVSIIDGPEFHSDLGRGNVIYLHRNVSCRDPEEWILTRAAMRNAWENNSWEAVVVRRSAAAPVVLFAGLGSPADVLEHSVREIRQAVSTEVFLADPNPDIENSPFFTALGIERGRVIPVGWVDLMDALAAHVASKQCQATLATCHARAVQERWAIDTWDGVKALLSSLDLMKLGELRACWTLQVSGYVPWSSELAEQLAELFAVIQVVIDSAGCHPHMGTNGTVVFVGIDGMNRGAFGLATGRGARSFYALELDIDRYRKYARERTHPDVYVVTGVNGRPTEATPPKDIVIEECGDELVVGLSEWSIVVADEVIGSRNVEKLIA